MSIKKRISISSLVIYGIIAISTLVWGYITSERDSIGMEYGSNIGALVVALFLVFVLGFLEMILWCFLNSSITSDNKFRERLNPKQLVGQTIICRFHIDAGTIWATKTKWQEYTVERLNKSETMIFLKNTADNLVKSMTVAEFKKYVIFCEEDRALPPSIKQLHDDIYNNG